jgi:hypothetical protein
MTYRELQAWRLPVVIRYSSGGWWRWIITTVAMASGAAVYAALTRRGTVTVTVFGYRKGKYSVVIKPVSNLVSISNHCVYRGIIVDLIGVRNPSG